MSSSSRRRAQKRPVCSKKTQTWGARSTRGCASAWTRSGAASPATYPSAKRPPRARVAPSPARIDRILDGRWEHKSTTVIKGEIERLLLAAVRSAQEAGALPGAAVSDALVERPQRPDHGDYASSLPLRLARAARMSPMDIAAALADRVRAAAGVNQAVASVEVAPPGFLNFRLSPQWLPGQVEAIIPQAQAFGNVVLGEGQTLQVEFVSANPVGPVHVGNGRGLALGDTLARVLSAAAYIVQREYLVNDAGTQTAMFTATLYARYQELFGRDVNIPEIITQGGYPGEYMIDLAGRLK